MLKEYRMRPDSFKRRVIERCHDNNLLQAEQRWLNLIKSEELYYNKGIYYNIKRFAAGGDTLKYHKDRETLIKKRYGKNHSDAIKTAIRDRSPEAKALHIERRIKSLKELYANGYVFYQSKPINVYRNEVFFCKFDSILDAAKSLKCDYSCLKERIDQGIWIVKQNRKNPFNVGDIITFKDIGS